MRAGAQIAFAVASGYVLGRFHKLRWALTLAAAGAAGRMTTGTSGTLREQGQKLLANTELGESGGSVGAGLVQAGKAAAATAVSNRLSSLSDMLRDRSEAMRDVGEADSDAPEDETAEETDTGEEVDEGAEEEPVRRRSSSGQSRRQPRQTTTARKGR